MWRLRHRDALTRLSFVLVFLVNLSVGAPVLSVAQQKDAADGARLVEEVAGLRKAVERAAMLLDELSKNQRLDAVLKRIELKERRLAPIEAELRAARMELVRQQEMITRIEARFNNLDDRFREEIQSGSDDPEKESDRRIMRQEMEANISAKSGTLAALESRIQMLEDNLEQGREEIRGLEDALQRVLPSKPSARP
jgi:hypothetical protein